MADNGSKWSLWSEDSILSIASKGSVLSIGSVGSVLSIGSIASAASAFSISSCLSLGSIMSFRSQRGVMTSGKRWAGARGAQSGQSPGRISASPAGWPPLARKAGPSGPASNARTDPGATRIASSGLTAWT